jgi:DNA-binding CsgD family transcriptional regulator
MTPKHQVHQLEPDARPDRIAAALRLWADGDFASCLRELDDIAFDAQTSESVLIRARALLRLDRVDAAETWLHLTASKHATADTRATYLMLAGSAAARLRKPMLAHELFDEAERLLPHKSVCAELAYYRALEQWQDGRNDDARTTLALALDPSEDIIYARALSLVGWTYVAEQRYGEGTKIFGEALAVLRQCRNKDAHLYATLLHATAIGVAELPAGDAQRLAGEVEEFAWTAGELDEHFQTLRHIGLAFVRRGQIEPAFRYFVSAADLAPRSAWAVLAFADCAAAAASMNEPHGARAFLQFACAASEHVNWNLVEGEPRLALLQLALALARFNKGSRARRYVAQFGESANFQSLSALRDDPRADIYRRHVDAVVAGVSGDPSALAALEDVRRSWAGIGYHWRALEAEQDIKCVAKALVQEQTAGPAFSAAAASSSDEPHMTEEQRRLMRLVLEGRSRKEIAAHLNLSINTVRNYLSVLYRLFQVSTRSELIVRCIKDERVLESIAR